MTSEDIAYSVSEPVIVLVFFSYIKGNFALDMLGCFPWDAIYKVKHHIITTPFCNQKERTEEINHTHHCCFLLCQFTGRIELVRYLVWLRLYRARKIQDFFKKMEKDIRISYLFTRIAKLITVELYCTHTAACVFYYLATTLPPAREGSTWIGSLAMGDHSYINFREIDLLTRYITSLYLAIVTMATVGKLSAIVTMVNLSEL